MTRTIEEIYQTYQIPWNLRMHMLRVAAIADQITNHWNGPAIEKDSLIRVLLLHDMGNIIKIELGEQSDFQRIDAELLGTLQKKYKDLYGQDDHQISREIGREVGLTDQELSLMDGKIFVKNEKTIKADSFERKIGAYADQRVSPTGVLPILERLTEAQLRYQNRPGSSMNNPRTQILVKCAVILERQVMDCCDIAPEQINDDSISHSVEELKKFKI